MAVATAVSTPVERTAARPRSATATAGRRRWLYPATSAAGDAALITLAAILGLPAATSVGVAAAAVAIVALRGHYRTRLSPSLAPFAGEIALVGAAVAAASALLAPGKSGWGIEETVGLGLVTVAALLAGRIASNQLLILLRERGAVGEAAVIVGAGQLGVELARLLQAHPRYGLRVIGFVDDLTGDEQLPLPLLGGTADLADVLRHQSITRVLVAFGATPEASIVPLIRACDPASVQIHVLPRFFELGQGGRDVDLIWGLPLRRLRRGISRPIGWKAKRAFDVVVSATLLVLLSPLYAAIAIGLKVSDRGPVLFRQQRVGRRGQPIGIYKFRSVCPNDESDTRWTVEGDDRVTTIGRVLRRTCLDELPQLFNVLRGDMSIVGPRPERPFFVRRFSAEVPRYADRHRAPVGITGWAQVHGLRGDTSIAHRARFDNGYIENWSLWLDLVILVRTAVEVLKSALRRRGR